MTKQEKLDYLLTLLEITGNTTKVVRHFLMQGLQNIEDESKIDEIINLLEPQE